MSTARTRTPFSVHIQETLGYAHQEACMSGCYSTEPYHLLFGLARVDRKCIAMRLCMLSGFEPVDVQEIINVKFKRQRSSVFYDTPSYSRDAQRTLDFAYMIACEWKDSEIRTEHLLIALIALSCEGDDLAAVFSEMELTVGKIRNHFLAILGNKSISLSIPSPPPDRNLM